MQNPRGLCTLGSQNIIQNIQRSFFSDNIIVIDNLYLHSYHWTLNREQIAKFMNGKSNERIWRVIRKKACHYWYFFYSPAIMLLDAVSNYTRTQVISTLLVLAHRLYNVLHMIFIHTRSQEPEKFLEVLRNKYTPPRQLTALNKTKN
jgi:hypothetical protein